ncbi:MAG: TraR/DksA family transcriptional regulator [Acidobacteriota bacterium]
MPQTKRAEASTADLEPLRQRLEQRREEIMNLYQSDLAAGQASGDEGSDDIVDRANNSYNREFLFSLSNNERAMLVEMDDALARIDAGSYGSCQHCGRVIGEARLEAVPWARYCIDCQELKEQGLLEDD